MNSDIRFYWGLVKRRLPLMLVIFVLCSAIGLGLAATLPARYSATARLLVESPQIPDELAASTVTTQVGERLQVIENRLLTRANLIDIANQFEIFRGAGRMSPDEVVKAMRTQTSIRTNSGRNSATFMDISFNADDARLAANVANQFVTLVLNEDSRRRQALAEQTLEFFQQEVARLDVELASRSADIVRFKEANKDALPENLDYRVNRLSSLQDQVINATRDRAILDEQRSRLMIVGSNQVTQLSPEQRALEAAKAELEAALTVYSATNPRIKVLEARVSTLEAQANSGSNDEDTPSTDPSRALFDLELEKIDRRAEFLDAQIARAQEEIAELRVAIEKTPENAIRLESLNRDYSNTQSQYNGAVAALARAQTGERIEVLSKGERITVIEQAVAPTEPNSPNRLLIAGGGVGVGLALSVGIFLLLELTNRAIRRPVDLTRGLSIQPIATVPYLESQGGKTRRRALQTILIAGLAIGIPAALWAIHTYYLPLDLVIERILNKFGL